MVRVPSSERNRHVLHPDRSVRLPPDSPARRHIRRGGVRDAHRSPRGLGRRLDRRARLDGLLPVPLPVRAGPCHRDHGRARGRSPRPGRRRGAARVRRRRSCPGGCACGCRRRPAAGPRVPRADGRRGPGARRARRGACGPARRRLRQPEHDPPGHGPAPLRAPRRGRRRRRAQAPGAAPRSRGRAGRRPGAALRGARGDESRRRGRWRRRTRCAAGRARRVALPPPGRRAARAPPPRGPRG